jgi:tetratricopeptide (TPR) repeat protein
MAKTLGTQKKRPKQKRSRHRASVAALLGGVLFIAGFGVYIGYRAVTGPADPIDVDAELPSLDWTGADPAVAAAVEAARAAVRQSPHSASAWGRLGMILGAHEFAAEANACFVHAERLDPREGRWPYYQGTELCLNDPEVAAAKLQRAADLLNDRSNGARLRLGEILLRQGRPNESGTQFRRLLQQDRENALAHLNLARIARDRGDLPASLEHLAHAMKSVYTRKAARLLAAEIHQRRGDAAAAGQERQLAAKLPNDLNWPDPLVEEALRLRTGRQARLTAAAQLLAQGHVLEAADLLRRIVQDYPSSDWAWLLFGRSLLAQKDLAGAEPALRKAVQLAPTSMEAHFYLGVALLLKENPRDAAACFRHAAAIQPDFADAYHNLAHCLLRQGDRKGAIEAFRAALNCKPNHIAAHLDLADVLVQEGRSAEAVAQARYAVELNPAEPRAKKLLEQLQSGDKMTR